MRRAPARPVFACFVRTCCAVVVRGYDLRATTVYLISNHLISSHLMPPHLSSSHLIPSLLTCHLSKFFSTVFISSEHWKKYISTHLSCSPGQKALTVRAKSFAQKHETHRASAHKRLKHRCIYIENTDNILCTTKLAQSTSQYYFVLQSLHKVCPSTTLYHKACTQHFPALLCTTKLAQSTSQHYLVLQACTKHFPALLSTTKLAQSISQYYFVLQNLHKALPSTTLYYKACTKHFPESTSQYRISTPQQRKKHDFEARKKMK